MEHFDVIIVGAGLSGIGAGVHISTKCPDKKILILEARAASGGTWDLFRYPGIRSDSDMFTMGYKFKPWMGEKVLADGQSILNYVRETAREYNLDTKIRYNHKVKHLAFSSQTNTWTVHVAKQQSGDVSNGNGSETIQISSSFVFLCSGYYNYDHGYAPMLPGEEKFNGPVIHPQKWPEDLDYSKKKVVIIGSGATAVTLLPAMSDKAAHVTMLQRTPTYIVSVPSKNPLRSFLYAILPIKLAYILVRWNHIVMAIILYFFCQRFPNFMKSAILAGITAHLGKSPETLRNFSPPYKPWEQRMCLVPDNDLFEAVKAGRGTVVTGTIDTFTANGIKLKSGEELPADIVIKATGLEIQAMTSYTIEVDGNPMRIGDCVCYRGVMLGNIPNLGFVFGYLNASWTLKADLACEYFCRVLNEMKAHGYRKFVPVPPKDMKTQAFTTFTSGYLQRALERMPKQGVEKPWIFNQNYITDLRALLYDKLDKYLVMSKV